MGSYGLAHRDVDKDEQLAYVEPIARIVRFACN
jgi:hypothetical protein